MYRRDMVEIQDLTRKGEPSSEYRFLFRLSIFSDTSYFCRSAKTNQRIKAKLDMPNAQK